MSKAHALVRLLTLMGEQGCSHEQRRHVRELLAEKHLMPTVLYPEIRRIDAVSDSGTLYQFTYPAAAMPTSFGR